MDSKLLPLAFEALRDHAAAPLLKAGSPRAGPGCVPAQRPKKEERSRGALQVAPSSMLVTCQ